MCKIASNLTDAAIPREKRYPEQAIKIWHSVIKTKKYVDQIGPDKTVRVISHILKVASYDLQMAQSFFKHYQQLSQGSWEDIYVLSKLHYVAGNYDQCITLIDQQPEPPTILLTTKAEALRKQAKYHEAIKLCTTIFTSKEAPKKEEWERTARVQAASCWGYILYQQNQTEQAINMLAESLKVCESFGIEPFPRQYMGLAYAEQQRRNMAAARQYANQALEIDAGNEKAKKFLEAA